MRNDTEAQRKAKFGNRNAIVSGLSSFLATGRWPRGASYVPTLLNGLRAGLAAAYRDRPSDLTPEFADSLIQSALRHEGRALLLQRKLRLQSDDLTLDQTRAVLADISDATDRRDRCIRQLGLDRKAKATIEDVRKQLYAGAGLPDVDALPSGASVCDTDAPQAANPEKINESEPEPQP
jgi:hypothetical protein